MEKKTRKIKIFSILLAGLLVIGSCFASEYKYTDTLIYHGNLYTAGLFTDKDNMEENVRCFISNYICPELASEFSSEIQRISKMTPAEYIEGDNYPGYLEDFEFIVIGDAQYTLITDNYYDIYCSIKVLRNVNGNYFVSQYSKTVMLKDNGK